jgi:pyridoxamine 5'-phosphate oxidase family protein
MMSTFSELEVEYLTSQLLGRIATVGVDGAPHVTPVGVFFDPETETIVIGSGADMPASKKFRDASRRPDVAVVIDDVASVDPWTPRGVEIRGRADTPTTGGELVGKRLGAPFEFHPAYIRVHPRRIVAWGLDTGSFAATARDVA